jgi:hypothetical protein
MTIAVTLAIEMSRIRLDDNGFKKEPLWTLAVRKARLIAARNNHELSWESGASDASEELTFEDGSVLGIHNPRQNTFGGYVYVGSK